MPAKLLPSVRYLRECFSYDPATGELRWKFRPRKHYATDGLWKRAHTRWAGKLAGNVEPSGYLVVCLDGEMYKVHRIIWKIVTGKEPLEVDHINRKRADNRWVNLRTDVGNQHKWNRSTPNTNTSGLRGASLQSGRWRAQIVVNGVKHSLGMYDSREQAAAVYEEAARKMHGRYYRE